jgi:hypothetical protein
MAIPTKAQVRGDVNVLHANAPARPVGDRSVEVCIVGRRCVYVNNFRIAGGKPYVSESLPQHILKTSLRDVLSAFSAAEIRAALREEQNYREYFRDYHAQPEDEPPALQPLSQAGEDGRG